MENYKFTIKRLFYPGETEALSPALPSTYVSETYNGVPTGQNCGNCYFNNNRNLYFRNSCKISLLCNKIKV